MSIFVLVKNNKFIMWTLLSILLVFTGVEAKEMGSDTLRERSISSEIRMIGTVYALKVKYKGNIKVTDDDKEITYITSGGYIEISKKAFGSKRELLIESDVNGSLQYTYRENRREVSYDPDGKQFLEDVLLEVIRSSDVAALDRINRFFERGGVGAVLREIDQISSSSSQATYYAYLLERKGLTGNDLAEIVRSIGKTISSSSSKGSILRQYAYKFLSNDVSGDEFFRAVDMISSSSEKGETLRKVLNDERIPKALYPEMLRTTSRISSSSEQGSVLRAFNTRYLEDETTQRAYFRAVEAISSSSEQGSVLSNLLQQKELDERSMIGLFEAVESISSSSEKGHIMRLAAEQLDQFNEPLTTAYVYAVRSISSSSEQGSVLRTAINDASLSDKSVILLLNTSQEISSSSEKGSVLRNVIDNINTENQEVLNAYFEAVGSISSSSEQGSLLRGIVKKTDVTVPLLMGVMETSGNISSSSELASVLIEVAEFLPEYPELKEDFKKAARNISSDSEYRRVIEKL